MHGGRAKKRIGDPRGWVGGSEAKKGPGPDFFPMLFYGVFKLSSPRNAQTRDQQKMEKTLVLVFCRFFCKSFSTQFFWFFVKRFL
jgi:hypothetical protein